MVLLGQAGTQCLQQQRDQMVVGCHGLQMLRTAAVAEESVIHDEYAWSIAPF